MQKRFTSNTDESISQKQLDKKSLQFKHIKMRLLFKQDKLQFRRHLFGDHYNHSKIHLNKEKKYLLEQQKNTEIEKNNRILLDKIQQISTRSIHLRLGRKRMYTHIQDTQEQQQIKQSKHHPNSHKNHDLSVESHNKLVRNSDTGRYSRKYKKMLFNIVKTIKNQSYRMIGEIQNNNLYVLNISSGQFVQKIKIDYKNYRNIYKEILEFDHSKIIEFLNFNKNQVQLCGIDKQFIISQKVASENVVLPLINIKTGSKSKEKSLI